MFFMFEDLVGTPPPATPPIDFLGLPGFAEAKAHLEERGFPSAWITDVVDPTEKHAFFNKNGLLLCAQAAKTFHTICKKEKAFKRSF